MNARLALKFCVDQETRGHARVAVFVGPDLEHLALSGNLTFRQDEWALVRRRLGQLADLNVLVMIADRELPLALPAVHADHPDRVPGCALCSVSVAELA